MLETQPSFSVSETPPAGGYFAEPTELSVNNPEIQLPTPRQIIARSGLGVTALRSAAQEEFELIG